MKVTSARLQPGYDAARESLSPAVASSSQDDSGASCSAARASSAASSTEASNVGASRGERLRSQRFGIGLQASGFEPQRHTVLVEGRPTQVLRFLSFSRF